MIDYKDSLSACNVNNYSFSFLASYRQKVNSNMDNYLECNISIHHVESFICRVYIYGSTEHLFSLFLVLLGRAESLIRRANISSYTWESIGVNVLLNEPKGPQVKDRCGSDCGIVWRMSLDPWRMAPEG